MVGAIVWTEHAGHPHYGVHADGPRKGFVAAHVARPGGVRWQAHIPRHDGPWVALPKCDTFEELAAGVVAWFEANPPDPPPAAPERRGRVRAVENRPEPARWPRGARRR